MTLDLNECLRVVGLQHHYARFASMGVHHAAHLSALTMEDYHILGIHTMEDRTRLFHLVQMVKTLDLDDLEYEDGDDYDDYGADGGDEAYALMDSSSTYDDNGAPHEDVYDDEHTKHGAVNKLNATTFAKPSHVRRRLDFSCETFDHQQKLLSHPVGSVHVFANHNVNNEQVQSKGSATPLQLELESGSAVVFGYKGNHSDRMDAHRHQSNHHMRGITKSDIMKGTAMCNAQTRISPKFVSFHKQKPKPATVAPKRVENKPGLCKDRKRISVKEQLNTNMGSNGAFGCMAKPTSVYESKRTASYNYGLPQSSPPASKKKQEGEQRISVCVRKRPLTRAEGRRGEADVVTTSDGECVIVHERKEAVDLTQYILQHRFYFDKVFGEESSNEEVYQRTAYPLVQHMLNGGKATCFAYGQTGAGKTHTMLGSSPGRPGLYALAVRDIFAHLSTIDIYSPPLVYVSFFEIYCGQLYDLLDHRKRLFAREDGQKVVHIAGLHDVRVDSVSSLLEVISQGTEARTQGMSGVNPLSSRSHALLQIQLRDSNQEVAGRMWFVDLAGSERASDTKEPDRQSRMEGAEINQSLLALKECIRSLDQEQSHTPFRQSKLTQVLKDSFVGDSMTCMIANISPGHFATEHTLNTLRYADRVKELRGQGELRGRRRGKAIFSPKHNLPNSNSSSGSSVGTRRKSPPKKQKLGRQRETFTPITSNTRLSTGGAVLCSTPKNSRWEAETNAKHRKGIGLERITTFRGWLGMSDKRYAREGAGERKERRRENEKYGRSNSNSVSDQNTRPGLVLGQSADEHLNLCGVQKSQSQSEICHREKESQHCVVKGEGEEEKRLIQQERQVESSRDTCSEVESLKERDFKKVGERDRERQSHLRWYHQQLQQFMPSSTCSSVSLFSPSTCPSGSSFCQPSLSSSVSPSSSSSQHSSHFSASALIGLEEVLESYKAKVRAQGKRGQLPFPHSEIIFPTETPPCCNNKNYAHAHGDSGGVGEDWTLSWPGTEACFAQDSSESDRGRSLGTPGEAREGSRPAGMEGEERRSAWVTTIGTEQADRMTGAMATNVLAQVSHSCRSEDRRQVGEARPDSSDVPPDGMWTTEEKGGANNYSLVSTHNNDNNSLFHHPSFESPNQRAPAERPLSPACEHINALLTPNKLNDLSSDSKHTRRTSNILPLPLRNTKFSNCQLATQPLSTSITQTEYMMPAEALNKLPENSTCTQVHNHPEVKANMPGLPQDDTCADSLSYIMDPLSISMLQVDQQVTTELFLQGEQNSTLLCALEKKSSGDNSREVEKAIPAHHKCAEIAGKIVEDVKFSPSLLELPHTKTTSPPTFKTTAAVNHTEQGKGRCASCEHHGIGKMQLTMPEVMLISLQDQANTQTPQTKLGNKACASSLKSTPASMTSVMQPISPLVQHPGNTDSSSSISSGATQIPREYTHNMHNRPFPSISIPQSESVLGQCHTAYSNHLSASNNSLQPNSPAESNGQESTGNHQIRPITHLSALEDLDQAQWCVVQAHWAELEEMQALCRKEGILLCQQPDMAFGEYVHKLEQIMERKARCVHSMRAQLLPYLKSSHFNQPHNQGGDNSNPII